MENTTSLHIYLFIVIEKGDAVFCRAGRQCLFDISQCFDLSDDSLSGFPLEDDFKKCLIFQNLPKARLKERNRVNNRSINSIRRGYKTKRLSAKLKKGDYYETANTRNDDHYKTANIHKSIVYRPEVGIKKENKKVGKQENKKTKTRTNQLNKLNNDFIKLKRAYPSLIYLRR